MLGDSALLLNMNPKFKVHFACGNGVRYFQGHGRNTPNSFEFVVRSRTCMIGKVALPPELNSTPPLEAILEAHNVHTSAPDQTVRWDVD